MFAGYCPSSSSRATARVRVRGLLPDVKATMGGGYVTVAVGFVNAGSLGNPLDFLLRSISAMDEHFRAVLLALHQHGQ